MTANNLDNSEKSASVFESSFAAIFESESCQAHFSLRNCLINNILYACLYDILYRILYISYIICVIVDLPILVQNMPNELF